MSCQGGFLSRQLTPPSPVAPADSITLREQYRRDVAVPELVSHTYRRALYVLAETSCSRPVRRSSSPCCSASTPITGSETATLSDCRGGKGSDPRNHQRTRPTDRRRPRQRSSRDPARSTPCAMSYGPVPGSVYADHRFIDVLIHGWDLARGPPDKTRPSIPSWSMPASR